jgi:microsomal epoxide hydrolase
MEFLEILTLLRNRYSPDELPYHVIVPSLPGYAFSSTPPVDRNWILEDSARLLHELMCGLGFEGGYVLQGGDIGSYTARIMAALYDSCKGSCNAQAEGPFLPGRPGRVNADSDLNSTTP